MAQTGKVTGARPALGAARHANAQGTRLTVAASSTVAAQQAQEPRRVSTARCIKDHSRAHYEG